MHRLCDADAQIEDVALNELAAGDLRLAFRVQSLLELRPDAFVRPVIDRLGRGDSSIKNNRVSLAPRRICPAKPCR